MIIVSAPTATFIVWNDVCSVLLFIPVRRPNNNGCHLTYELMISDDKLREYPWTTEVTVCARAVRVQLQRIDVAQDCLWSPFVPELPSEIETARRRNETVSIVSDGHFHFCAAFSAAALHVVRLITHS